MILIIDPLSTNVLIIVETIVTASIPTMIQKLPLKLQPQRQRPYAMYNG